MGVMYVKSPPGWSVFLDRLGTPALSALVVQLLFREIQISDQEPAANYYLSLSATVHRNMENRRGTIKGWTCRK